MEKTMNYEQVTTFKSNLKSQCEAIAKGIKSAEERYLTEDLNVGISVLVQLEIAGWKVVRIPRKDGLTPGLR